MNLENYDKIEHEDGRIELIPKKKDADWAPEKEGRYWYINSVGDVQSETLSFAFDADRLSNHNCYPTRELAEKAAKLMRRSNAIIRACLLVEQDDDLRPSSVRYVPAKILGEWGYLTLVDVDTDGCSSKEKASEAVDLLKKWGVQ